MLNANTTWRRAAGVTLCAALLTTVVWAAWIPLSGWNSRKSSQDAGGSVPPLAVAEAQPAAPASRQITHPPEVVGKHDPSRVAATSPLAIPAAPLQSASCGLSFSLCSDA